MPSALPPGVMTKLNYRKPPPTPEFLSTPINLYSQAHNYKDQREVLIRDVRNELDRFTIEKDGLEFLHDAVNISNWDDDDEVKKVLLQETPELLKKRLGAKHVFMTAERIRQSVPHGEKSDTTPVYAIHGDATRQSGLELLHNSLKKISNPPSSKALPPNGRVMLVNVWRPLRTITRDPLAFLAPNSIKPEERHEQIFERPPDKFKVFGKPLGDYWIDTVSYGEQHEWVFLKSQQPSEPVMFVQWDSLGTEEGKFENRMSLFHTCFEESDYVNDAARRSMELKCLLFFDD